MSIFKLMIVALLVAFLASCGGGGGNSGAATGTTSGGTSSTTTASATMALAFTDSAGSTLSSNAITSGNTFYAKVTLTDSTGAAIRNSLVNFSTDAAVGKLSQSVALTDGSGVAKVQISPATISTNSAGTLTAQTLYSGTAINASANYQTSAASVAIAALTSQPATISALQSAAVSTSVTVGGSPATAGQVAVSFTASCGTFSPATATTSSSGSVTSTYQSDSSCTGGSVSLAANASGASNTGTIAIIAAAPANILFVSASPTSIVSSSATGTKQSDIRFKVVDSGSNAMAGQSVLFSLDSQSNGAGVRFNVGGSPTAANQTVNTDALGVAKVTIQSGALPTPVIVTAALVSTPTMFAYSSGVVVTAGKASQDRSSLSADKLSIEGLNTDGVTANLTWRVSDRQGNPVPVGSSVTFVASSGLVVNPVTGGGACTLDANSSCTMTYITSGSRPSAAAGGVNGRVAILAYMDGEESFVDTNGNNIWDASETFNDMGVAYRDDNFSGLWGATEQTYPGGATGTTACTGTRISVQNTCDGTWSSSIRVRQAISISLASSFASITLNGTASNSGFTVTIGDSVNSGIGMPTGSVVSAAVTTGSGGGCSVSSVSPNLVRNVNLAGDHDINLSGGTACHLAVVEVSVTTPTGNKTTKPFSIP